MAFRGNVRIPILLIAASCTCLHAGVISFLSGTDPTGTLQWNSRGGFGTPNTVITNVTSAWAQPSGGMQWVSFSDSGVGGLAIANTGSFGTLSAVTASFFLSFTLPNPINTGGIRVWADDTASVFLVDSTPKMLYAASTAQEDNHCVAGPIGCGQDEGGFVDLSGLAAGTHTLRIDAYQLGGAAFGVMYGGNIVSEAITLPEPSTGSYSLAFLLLAITWLGVKKLYRIRESQSSS